MDNAKLESLAERLLIKLRARPGHVFDPAKLARGFRVTGGSISSAVGLLQSWGYTIKADRNGFYSFAAAPDSLLATEIAYKLRSKIIGKVIYAYRSVQSTNTIAHQLAVSGSPEGTLVVAEEQTRGRGRLGRSWHSPEKIGLYCSIILRPKVHPTLAPGISLITAVAVADTIASYGSFTVTIKWPNDVLVSGKKTAGILTELSAELDRTNFVIVGLGVNINHKRSDFPEEIRRSASSIRIALNNSIKRVEFAKDFLYNFEKQYLNFKKHGLAKSRKKILKYSSLINTDIKLKIGRKTISGNVLNIDEFGRLVVRTAKGIEIFNAGEVTAR